MIFARSRYCSAVGGMRGDVIIGHLPLTAEGEATSGVKHLLPRLALGATLRSLRHRLAARRGERLALGCLLGWSSRGWRSKGKPLLTEHAAVNSCLKGMMQRFRSTVDPTRDPVAGKVVAAFDDAERAGLPSVNCYRAGVDVWRRSHPYQVAAYAAKQAVAVILKARVSLRFLD